MPPQNCESLSPLHATGTIGELSKEARPDLQRFAVETAPYSLTKSLFRSSLQTVSQDGSPTYYCLSRGSNFHLSKREVLCFWGAGVECTLSYNTFTSLEGCSFARAPVSPCHFRAHCEENLPARFRCLVHSTYLPSALLRLPLIKSKTVAPPSSECSASRKRRCDPGLSCIRD